MSDSPEIRFEGIGVSPGIAFGRIHVVREDLDEVVRYQIAPDPIRHLMTAVLPKRMVDKIIAKRVGLMPPVERI